MIPPTPVAAPWYGSTADGWLWLSIRTATASPSPMSMTPAPSPGPTSTHGASVGNRPRWGRDDLYEQCSDHITEYIASSRWVGSRPELVDHGRELVVGHAQLAVQGGLRHDRRLYRQRASTGDRRGWKLRGDNRKSEIPVIEHMSAAGYRSIIARPNIETEPPWPDARRR